MNERYEIAMEIDGHLARWTRPDCGDSFGTYPAPTYSAAKGIFESICFLRSVNVMPYKVEICSSLKHVALTTNYSGIHRKADQITKGNAIQNKCTALEDVCYKIYACVEGNGDVYYQNENGVKINSAHFYQERFEKRLKNGQSYTTPFLGIKGLVPTYIGPLREETHVEASINIVLPSMTKFGFGANHGGSMADRVFLNNVHIKNGTLVY